jgi:thymidylate kinase
MLTVAIVGADGAGKTTVARKLLESFPLPIKYLYMGMNAESSNVALPTTRLIYLWKTHKYKQSLRRSGAVVPKVVSLHTLEHRVDRRGKLGAAARLINRVAEESYRQIVSWSYQLRGYVVLYDRHFLFDNAPAELDSNSSNSRLTERIHHWFLHHVYPKPRLVIFLDAPPEVLYQRKQEVPENYLRANREALLRHETTVPHFVRVDATQPVEDVLAEVRQQIMQHCGR